MKYNGIIQRKLAILDDQVQKLRSHTEGVEYDSFAENWLLRSGCERALQVAAEIIIDIAERIIAIENAGPVTGASAAMRKLEDLGVISSSEPYASIVRFRNVIVHEYEEVDPRLLFTLISERLDDFLRFRLEIDRAG